MAVIQLITQLKELQNRLQTLQAEMNGPKNNCVYAVGYTARYALYVHESVGMVLKGQPRKSGIGEYWGPKGEAKFLEKPLRQNADEIRETIAKAVKNGATLSAAVAIGALRLQRMSQKLVPVETGNLKASAFTRREK